MKIRLKHNLKKRNPTFRFDLQNEFLGQEEMEVLAVMRNHHVLQYLIRCSVPGTPDALDWVSARDFLITDSQKNKNWIECAWPIWKPYIKIHSNYDFDFRLSYYCGPSDLLYSNTFLFESIEKPLSATRYLHQQTDNIEWLHVSIPLILAILSNSNSFYLPVSFGGASYIEGEITNGQIRKLLENEALHPGGSVPARAIYDAVTDMDITYWSAGDGIIWYETSSRPYLKPAPVVVPERSRSRSYSAQPSAGDILGSVCILLLYGAAYLTGLPAPSYTY